MQTEVIGVEQLISNLNGLTDELRAQIEKATVESVNDGANVARSLSPVKTGYFKSRWKVSPASSTRLEVAVELTNDAPYAAPLIFGHRTASGSHVAPRDCLTSAILQARQSLVRRLTAIQLTGRG